ncbi:DNA methyltransferase [Thalassospira sp. HJ]|uniref:DNA cytosine methyltransferase n=1 Tax=Thalassospira sp. HJ TaxID=1616823 RepID=UPI0005CF8F1C|nr:DNA cytosine methyltransferase [Thalassospira sp. HJ]KJE34972.1 DNA methyltransferase [Thalassospira sp. HJ]
MRAISLFSGAGGMDVGFEQAGFRVAWANDFDKDACATFQANFDTPIVQGDINRHIPTLDQFSDIDVLFGGPPCQGFSVAGKMDPNDERSQLVWSFMKAVEVVQPRAFVMENVKSLATLAKFSAIREKLFWLSQKLGYSYDLVVLNSRNFGVPQSRERMFFVGIKGDTKFRFEPEAKRFSSEEKAVRDIIFSLGKAGTEKNKRVCNAKITIAAKPVLRKSPYSGMLFNGQGRPVNPDTPSCTLHASMGGNRTPIVDENHLFEGSPSWVENYHHHLMNGGQPYGMNEAPEFLRRLTVDEALRIQTFPDDYEFIGRQSSVFRQIGNAVPCNLAFAVARAVRSILGSAETSANYIQNKQYVAAV